MVRKIVKIDKDKCDGCGLCVKACHESAIVLNNGKAELIGDDYCDGLGDCLPACPAGAISFEEREAAAYSEDKVKERIKALAKEEKPVCGCPGSRPEAINTGGGVSCLSQWPCQLKLVPIKAPFYEGAHIVIAADCAAFARKDFHHDFMKGKITLIGCPKLDNEDYSQKLELIFRNNDVKSIMVVRMEVPCCGGIEHFVKTAAEKSGKSLSVNVAVISTKGEIIKRGEEK